MKPWKAVVAELKKADAVKQLWDAFEHHCSQIASMIHGDIHWVCCLDLCMATFVITVARLAVVVGLCAMAFVARPPLPLVTRTWMI